MSIGFLNLDQENDERTRARAPNSEVCLYQLTEIYLAVFRKNRYVINMKQELKINYILLFSLMRPVS